MRGRAMRRIWVGMLCALALVGAGAALAVPAQADFDDPIFLFRPLRPEEPEASPIPPPVGDFEGPCGLAVNSQSSFYVSDFYHHVISYFGPSKAYGGQIVQPEPLMDPNEQPNGGPCAMAFDASDNLYVNLYHR